MFLPLKLAVFSLFLIIISSPCTLGEGFMRGEREEGGWGERDREDGGEYKSTTSSSKLLLNLACFEDDEEDEEDEVFLMRVGEEREGGAVRGVMGVSISSVLSLLSLSSPYLSPLSSLQVTLPPHPDPPSDEGGGG